MCSYNITLNDTLVEKVRPSFADDKALELWLQQQLERFLLSYYVQQEPQHSSPMNEQPLPDVVLSLLGASRSVNDEALQRLMDFAAANPKTITLDDLAGILPAPQASIEELRDEYISEKYGV